VPTRSEGPGEHLLPIRIKPPDTTRETASRWDQTAGAPASSHCGLMGKRKSGAGEGKPLSDHRAEQGSEGRSPCALEAETGLQGGKLLDATERVAKPYEWDLPGARQRSRDASKEAKKGALPSGYAEGPCSSGEVSRGSASIVDGSHRPRGGEAGAKTLRWRRSAGEEQPEIQHDFRGVRSRRPEGPGRSQGRTGRTEAMIVLGHRIGRL
jgi:hypothetical protein